ncbi:hypothetical protein METBIDRAFT_39147 [Metschnikowia bicuspidata var. bicuspidata NRRL YB-4993]|uniref:E3 ubiquitin-protein ligase PEP5 n=1 Tax=Metschnikowia bicuspidata var. bicuspidata NRRL YB-4993 TaxID=869754 RepID=A0A1A0HEG1_9ASCO|nr:hypothetical protein METBIDRAFT_39147 [Metschnikowia bicuspidata var. bicuspidata NRRL YB-4993]OBA22381.1 hypothetical protein METBIDRAFT_39147 [Metschnikowia bicuspidata var. bicuspidata NRRL YB-4993]
MSLPATWRQLQLFDFVPVRDPRFRSAEPLFSDPQLTAIAAVQDWLVFAAGSHVTLLDRTLFEPVQRFSAYAPEYTLTFLRPVPRLAIVVTVAEKHGAPAVLKVWDLHKVAGLDAAAAADADAMRHRYIAEVRIQAGGGGAPLSAVLFNDSLTCVAVGSAAGSVVLVRGELLRDRGAKQRLVYAGADPVTGVAFHRSDELLYVATTSRVFTLLASGRNRGQPLRVLSTDTGAAVGAMALDARDSRLLVASLDGFAYYSPVGRAQLVAFAVPKRQLLRLFRDYLLVVCPPADAPLGAAKPARVLILDMRNTHVAFSLALPGLAVAHVFPAAAGREAYVLATDGVLYRLAEKPLNQQVEAVLQRQLYPIALALAQQHGLDAATILRINRLHAESLCDKLDYASATQKYCDCLASFAGSPAGPVRDGLDDFVIDVVTRFKAVSHIHHMTTFLARLHELRLADGDHLTLLLCCYCKLNMAPELDAFIAGFDLGPDLGAPLPDSGKLNFLLVVNLLRECGYFSQAILLLYKLNHPRVIAEVQLNDLHDYPACLSYIQTLPVNELLAILIDYLKKLLDVMPLETTKLLIDVFTGKYRPAATHSLFSSDKILPEDPPEKNVEETSSYVPSYTAILGYLSNTLKQDDIESALEETTVQEPTYLPPRPSLVYSCFIDHSREFVVFLEACHETFEMYQGSTQEREDLIMTLFEMYCSISAEQTDENELWAGKATSFLEEQVEMIDKTKALMIAHMYGLQINDVFVKAKVAGADENAFRFAQNNGDIDKAFQIVREFGESKPAFYTKMLRFVASSKEIFQKASRKDFQYLLDKITQHKLATPLEVLKILSSNECSSVGIVKDYLIDYFGNVNKEIKNNEKLIELYEAESTSYNVKLSELQSQPFMLQNDLCSSCELKLEFPLIHFKCKHSHHQRCLSENTYIPDTNNSSSDPRCPLCASEIQNVQAIRENRHRANTEYDTFKMKLDESDDRFKVICEYLGRGAMDYEIC